MSSIYDFFGSSSWLSLSHLRARKPDMVHKKKGHSTIDLLLIHLIKEWKERKKRVIYKQQSILKEKRE